MNLRLFLPLLLAASSLPGARAQPQGQQPQRQPQTQPQGQKNARDVDARIELDDSTLRGWTVAAPSVWAAWLAKAIPSWIGRAATTA